MSRAHRRVCGPTWTETSRGTWPYVNVSDVRFLQCKLFWTNKRKFWVFPLELLRRKKSLERGREKIDKAQVGRGKWYWRCSRRRDERKQIESHESWSFPSRVCHRKATVKGAGGDRAHGLPVTSPVLARWSWGWEPPCVKQCEGENYAGKTAFTCPQETFPIHFSLYWIFQLLCPYFHQDVYYSEKLGKNCLVKTHH